MNDDEKAKLYIDLWKSENTVKTGKLMAYFAVQTLVALGAASGTGVPHSLYFFAFLGILSSVWWVFCTGRTAGYQQLWKDRVERSLGKDFFPGEEEKAGLPVYAKLPGRIIVLAPPVIGVVVWLVVVVFAIGLNAAKQ